MRVTRHLTVTGRVQGVGFRLYVQREARALGVNGWIRNRKDGSVEAVVQGTGESVDALIERVRRGPAASAVTEVQVSEASGEFSGFDIRPTA